MNTDDNALDFGAQVRELAEKLGASNNGIFSSIELTSQLGERPAAFAQVQADLLRVLFWAINESDRRLHPEIVDAWTKPINVRARLLYILGRLDHPIYEVDLRRLFVAAFQYKPSGEAWINARNWLLRRSDVRHGVQQNVQVYDPRTGLTTTKSMAFFARK